MIVIKVGFILYISYKDGAIDAFDSLSLVVLSLKRMLFSTNAELAEDGDDFSGSVVEGEDDIMNSNFEDDSIHAFQGHTDAIYAVAWSKVSPDTVATGGADELGFIWRVGEDAFMENQGDVFELRGHVDTITDMEFNNDGSSLATAGMDGCVKIWSVSDGKCIHTLDGPTESIDWLNWHPRGNVLLAGSSDFTVWMWNAQSGDFMMTFSGHAGPVSCGSFTPDGKAVVTGGGEGDATLRVWDPKTGQAHICVEGPHFHGTGITCLGIHPNGQTAICGAEAGTIRLVSLESGKVLGSMDKHLDGSSVEDIVYILEDGIAASAGMDGNLVVWDLASLSVRVECPHPEGITKLLAHPNNHLLISGGLDGIVRCWDARAGTCVHEFRGHTDAIQDMDMSPDGNQILSGGEDGMARVFDLRQPT
jgi:WD40 repeat protein